MKRVAVILGIILLAGPILAATVTQTASNTIAVKQAPRSGARDQNFYDITWDATRAMAVTDLPAIITEVNRQGGVIVSTTSNAISATLSSTGVDNGNLQVVGGSSANADGDDIGIRALGTDTGGTAVVYMDINVDMTDADDGTEDATITVAIPVAGTSETELTINSDGIASEAVTITPPSGVGTNAAAVIVTGNGVATDYTALFNFTHEGASFLTLDGGTFTNVFKALVTINGTNYAIPLVPAP